MPEMMNLHTYQPYLDMDEPTRKKFWLHMNAWSLSRGAARSGTLLRSLAGFSGRHKKAGFKPAFLCVL